MSNKKPYFRDFICRDRIIHEEEQAQFRITMDTAEIHSLKVTVNGKICHLTGCRRIEETPGDKDFFIAIKHGCKAGETFTAVIEGFYGFDQELVLTKNVNFKVQPKEEVLSRRLLQFGQQIKERFRALCLITHMCLTETIDKRMRDDPMMSDIGELRTPAGTYQFKVFVDDCNVYKGRIIFTPNDSEAIVVTFNVRGWMVTARELILRFNDPEVAEVLYDLTSPATVNTLLNSDLKRLPHAVRSTYNTKQDPLLVTAPEDDLD